MKKKILLMIIAILFIIGLTIGGAYAFWSVSSNNKSVVFNTAYNLRNYVTYDPGEAQFSGSLQVGNSYSTGIHTTISVSKDSSVSSLPLVGTIYMDVNSIGTNMQNSSALKWAVTSGNSTNVGSVLAEGNFIGVSNNTTLTLYPSFAITTVQQQYTIWIWLDQNEDPDSSLSNETLDTSVWTEINQAEAIEESFTITQINANYDIITATAVNTTNNINAYAVTTSSTEPSSWETIDNPNKTYSITYEAPNVNTTYYVWFKDTEENTVSRLATVGNFYIANIYYNGDSTSGNTNIKNKKVYCLLGENESSCVATIPTEITQSVGTYNNQYAGLSNSTDNMTRAVNADATQITLAANATYYSLYSSSVNVYSPSNTSSCTNSTYYRNQWFMSSSALSSTVLANSNSGTSNNLSITSVGGFTFNAITTDIRGNGTSYDQTGAVNSDALNLYVTHTRSKSANFYYYDGTAQNVTTASGTQMLYCTNATTAGYGNGNIDVPSVVTSSTGPNSKAYFGLSTSPSSISSTTTITTASDNYYALYGSQYTATFVKENNNVTAIGSTSLSCGDMYITDGTTYDGVECQITLPTITANSGYVVLGWYDDGDGLIGQPGDSISLTANVTYTAKAKLLQAREFFYDNSNSGVSCSDVQCMIDYLDGNVSPNATLHLGDYISYTPSKTSFTTNKDMTGYTNTQTINPSELNLWRVIRLNQDGTVDIISEHVSSTSVYFKGQAGYQNFVGYLNVLASQYETDGITVGSRHFGYHGQTEYITDTQYFVNPAPWTCSTSGASGNCASDPDDYESSGGGDTLYTTDYNLINTVLGTRAATNPSGTRKEYWMASRYYYYSGVNSYEWRYRRVTTGGGIDSASLYYYSSSGFGSAGTRFNPLRPIVTLKSGLSFSGAGTAESPYTIQSN